VRAGLGAGVLGQQRFQSADEWTKFQAWSRLYCRRELHGDKAILVVVTRWCRIEPVTAHRACDPLARFVFVRVQW